MNDKLFSELLESMAEGVEILNGKAAPSRVFFAEEIDAKLIRSKLKLSQSKFSRLLGISVATLKNWEQGIRIPTGPGKVLLSIASKHPEVLLDTQRSSAKGKAASKMKDKKPTPPSK